MEVCFEEFDEQEAEREAAEAQRKAEDDQLLKDALPEYAAKAVVTLAACYLYNSITR